MIPTPIPDSGTWLLLEAIVFASVNPRVASAKVVSGK